MMLRSCTAALALTILAVPAAPQEPKLVESIEVRVANVDVVVRDKAGHPVTGLTKDDFELFENGVAQPITNFYEVRRAAAEPEVPSAQAATPSAPAAPPELRRRRFILFIDVFSTSPARKSAVLDSLTKFVDTQLHADDQAMLVVWRNGMDVVTPFTSDREAIRKGIGRIARAAGSESRDAALRNLRHDIDDLIALASSTPPRITFQAAYAQSRAEISVYAEGLMVQEQHQIDVLGRLMATLGAIEGKKVLVYAGEHLPEHPGAELFQYAFSQFEPHMGRNTPFDVQAATGVVGNTTSVSIESLAKRASAYGVTIYTIDAADDTSGFSAENDVAPDVSETFSRYQNTAGALRTLAQLTGGVAVEHTQNFDFAFDTIARDLDSYYSLGYKPADAEKTGERKVLVKAKNRDYSVRGRTRIALQSAEEQMDDRVIANLYTDSIASTWPISIRLGTPKKDGGKMLVPVQVVMPSTITLLPQEGSLVGGFILYFAVGSGSGATSEIMKRPQGVKIPANVEAVIRAKPITYTTALRVNPGESVLSVGVVDQISGAVGFARTKIEAR